MNTTIAPYVAPLNVPAFAFRGFSLPEGTIKPDGSVHVWAIKVDGPRVEWVEAIGRNVDVATTSLIRELTRN